MSTGAEMHGKQTSLERGAKKALITSPECIERALTGETGTWIVP